MTKFFKQEHASIFNETRGRNRFSLLSSLSFLPVVVVLALFVTNLFPSLAVPEAVASTFYVRADGGTSTQCNGLYDAAYPGSGTNQNCAFNHPFWALPPGRTPVLKGGDTLVIGPGQYRIGLDAPNTTGATSVCYAAWAYDCLMPDIPPGPDASHPTRILGRGWDDRSTAPPELYGVGRVSQVMRLGGSNIEVRYLDITDHSSCIYNSPNPANRCDRSTAPFGEQADYGVVAGSGSKVLLKDLKIHGLSVGGLKVGNVSDWTLENVTVRANGFVGWEGDLRPNPTSNSGSIHFKKSKIEFSGCGEKYPTGEIYGCFSQSRGGYGDGLGTGPTGGNWIFEDSEISHNTSDGLDLLYHSGTGSITIKRSRFEGNAGNQLKVAASTEIQNSIIVGNCDYFNNNPITEPGDFDHCRAAGNSIAMAYNLGLKVSIANSTVLGHGDTLLLSSGDGCNGTEKLVSRNNIFLGGPNFVRPGTLSGFYYASGKTGNGDGTCGTLPIDNKDSIVYSVKENLCPNSNSVLCSDPLLSGPLSGNTWGITPRSASPAIGRYELIKNTAILGTTTIPTDDFLGLNRPNDSITWGAYEGNPVVTSPTSPTNLRVNQ